MASEPESSAGMLEASARRARPVVAWLVILSVVAVVVAVQNFRSPEEPAAVGPGSFWLVEVHGRYLVGVGEIAPELREELARSVASLNTGPVGQRLRAIALRGELAGPRVALADLALLDGKLAEHHVAVSEDEARLLGVLRRAYAEAAAGRPPAAALAEGDQALIKAELGWCGRLVVAPAGLVDEASRDAALSPARRTLWGFMGGIAVYLVLGLAGVLVLPGFLARLVRGRIRAGIGGRVEHGGVYAETFAVWLVVFVGSSVLLDALAGGRADIEAGVGASLFSLTALFWPRVRAVGWSDMRRDLGLTLGRGRLLEPIVGIAAYAMCLPFLAAAVVVTLLLFQLVGIGAVDLAAADDFVSVPRAPHPVVEVLAGAASGRRVWILVLAGIVAPAVEEVMFRGLLYRHLREASSALGFTASFLFSAATSALLFALVHPQGWVGVPVISAIGFGLALAREWRGSLVASIVAHAINNTTIVALLVLATSD